MIDKENLLKTVKTAISEGKTVRFIKTWTGLHVVGNRRFHNLNLTVKIDDIEILNADYQTDKDDTDEVEDIYDEIKEKMFDMLREKALELLAGKLGFTNIDEMYAETTVLGDDDGNPVILTKDEKVYSAVFCHFHLSFYTGKDIETFAFHEPKLVELKDC